jgi:hypothetical protein
VSVSPSYRSALVRATAVGTVLQLAMVLSGHRIPAIANLFGILGVAISFVAGLLFARWAGPLTRGRAMGGGALAGGACALLGIVVSYALGDVTALILVVGTASSAVTGLLGGLAGRRAEPALGSPPAHAQP